MRIILDRQSPKSFLEMTEEELQDWLDKSIEEDSPLTKEQAKVLREALGRMKEGGPGSGHHGHAGRPGKRGGSLPGKGKGAPTAAFDKEAWEKKDFMSRREEWEELSVKERDQLADAANSVPERMEEMLDHAGERPEFDGDVSGAIDQRVSDISEIVPPQAVEPIAQVTHELDGYLEEAGVAPEVRHQIAMEVADALAVQENEALGRVLGDHGIAHLQGDINMAMEMIGEVPGMDTPEEKAKIYLAGVFHDTGYLTGPSHIFLDEGHPRWSAQHYNENLKPLVSQALGNQAAEDLSHMIRTHDSTSMNWFEDPSGSAFRVADNMALFQKEKLPPVFRYVDGNTAVLKDLAEKRIDVPTAQKLMKANIAATDYNPWVKSELTRSVGEVTPVLPKYTLGMLAGEVDSFKWKEDHMQVSLRRTSQYDYLTQNLDLGQRQFSKLAKTYGTDPEGFKKSLDFSFIGKDGKLLLRGIVTGVKRETWKRLLTGGPGSGHHGHAGRPGRRGGSLPGIASAKKDLTGSAALGKQCRAEAKQCYKNAVMAIPFLKEDVEYVEGHFVADFGDFQYPLDHAWLRKSDGTILDPTLPEDEGVYFEAKAWSGVDALRIALREGQAGPYIRYDDPRWRKSAEAANEYAFGEFLGQFQESTGRLAEALFRKVKK